MARPEGSAGALRRAAWITGVLVFSAGMTGSVTAASAKRSAVKQDAATVRSDAALDKARLAIREKNFDGAMRELDTLAKRGNAHAMYLLGALLLANPAGEPDPARALPLLEKAAAAGVPRAALRRRRPFRAMAARAPDQARPRDWPAATPRAGTWRARCHAWPACRARASRRRSSSRGWQGAPCPAPHHCAPSRHPASPRCASRWRQSPTRSCRR